MVSPDFLQLMGLLALFLGGALALHIFQGPPPRSPHDTPAE